VDGSGLRLAVVLLGASRWPEWPELNNTAFTVSYTQFREYMRGDLQIPAPDVLDLFDSPLDPDAMVKAIQEFLAGAAGRAVTDLIVYYVGHGGSLTADEYGLLTACASRDRPSSVFRVSYLDNAIQKANVQTRVHLILDACYSATAATEFTRPLRSSGLAMLASTSRADKAYAPADQPTPFTRTLLAVLRRGVSMPEKTISLAMLRDLVRDELSATQTDETTFPELHVPLQRKGDVSRIGIFPNPKLANRVQIPGDGRRWCAVVSSSDAAEGDFRDTINGFIDRYRQRLEIELGWRLATAPEFVEAEEVFRTPRAFQECTATVCSADLAFFDLTGLEPAVLVLLGMRAVIRRGVTICSVRDEDSAAVFDSPPFLLRDVNVVRHGPGVDTPEKDFGGRVLTGIRQLSRTPHGYSDLPAFDLMRQPLPDDEGRTIKPYSDSVLVLCSFGDSYTARNWRQIKRMLPGAILNRRRDDHDVGGDPVVEPVVERTLDMGSPQVVPANLFLAMRWNDLCVCDLTQWRPNVLFELGLRLAAHPLHPVCIIDETWVPEDDERIRDPTALDQVTDLRRVLGVISYAAARRASYYDVVDAHLRMREALVAHDATWNRDALPVGSIYQVAWQYADAAHEPSVTPILELLQEPFRAKPLNLRDSWPFVFPANHELSSLTRQSVTERLIAAWLYAEHRFAGGTREGLTDDVVRHVRTVGTRLQELLTESPDEMDLQLLERIDDRLERLNEIHPMNWEEVLAEAGRSRSRARTYTRRGDLARARAVLERLVDLLEASLSVYDDPDVVTSQPEIARALSDTYGMLGGVERRAGELNAAQHAYERGRGVEQNPAYRIVDSYNLVNAFVLRILAVPGDFPSLRNQLELALKTVAAQVQGMRRDQWWAWADYALLALLTGDAPRASYGYVQFAACGPGPSGYGSVLGVLRSLRDVLAPVDAPVTAIIDGAIADLDTRR
jgi:Caspase domain